MLKPVQMTSVAQPSEQSCSEDGEMVLLAVSSAHMPGPSFVFLDFL